MYLPTSNHRANGWLGGARREMWEFAPAAAEPSSGDIYLAQGNRNFNMCVVKWVAKVLVLVLVVFVAGPRIHQGLVAVLLGYLLFR